MTDRYERIRKALAMGPTPGPWEALSNFVRTHPIGEMGGFLVAECPANIGRRLEDAAHIAACDPDTIRALMEERDALAKDAARYAIARRMSPQQWADAWELNHRTGKPFDEIIDDLAPFFDAAVAGRGKDERD